MSHIFISYSEQDKDFANRLATDLEAAGVKIWLGRPDIETELTDGLLEADTLVVIISPDSVASGKVGDEVLFARHHDIAIVPVLFRPAQIFLNLETLPWVDLSTEASYNTNFKKLLGLAADPLLVVADTRYLSSALLHQYVHVVSVVAAPFADSSGREAPLQTLSAALEWQKLTAAIGGQSGEIAFALTRLTPPTQQALGEKLAVGTAHILHFAGYSNEDVLYLENEWGHEAPLYPQSFLKLLQGSTVQVVVLECPLSADTIDLLLEETPVQAIISTQVLPTREATSYFARYFYAALATGQSVRTAFEKAVNSFRECCPNDEFIVTFKNGQEDIRIELPAEWADTTLIDNGLPFAVNVPLETNFVGHRNPLTETSQEIASAHFRQIAIYGDSGIGKSALVAEYVARSGWRYPDGILWLRVTKHTKSEDVIEQLLALLEMPLNTNWATLRDILRERSVLVVLDQCEEWADPVEIGELADFIARLDNLGGTRILLTSAGRVQPLSFTSGTEENIVTPLAPDEAERLVQWLLYEYDLSFPHRDMMDIFIEKTCYLPWLIRAGIDLIKTNGFEAALETLAELTSEVGDIYEHYINTQLEKLSEEARLFLRQLQGLPNGFDRGIAEAIAGVAARDITRELLQLNLLHREGNLYYIRSKVRFLLNAYVPPLNDDEQDQVDEIAIKYMLRTKI